MSKDVDDILDEAGGESFPAIKFAEVGETYKGVITSLNAVTRPSLKDGTPEDQVVINLNVEGEDRSLWFAKNSFLAGAIKEARDAAGQKLTVGGTLAVRMTELRDTGKPNKARIFKAKYEPPVNSGVTEDEIF